ncbi:hypothetical protein [Streptomyces sp. RKND-216]|uniref:hypothetical protein n=1 Tax=Streptomyces sp. RKND-216 TaxID=2562581 RepID=UPI001445D2AC|nr:hypothetical protein [Streptomyces sp. RKND-216]
MTTLIVAVGGTAVLLGWLLWRIVRRERRRIRLGHGFRPESKGLADIREARRSARTVREVGALHPPRYRG